MGEQNYVVYFLDYLFYGDQWTKRRVVYIVSGSPIRGSLKPLLVSYIWRGALFFIIIDVGGG